MARAERNQAFRAALFSEAVDLLISGDVETGKAVMRDYINATVGFKELVEEVGTPSKSLMRMLSERAIQPQPSFYGFQPVAKGNRVHLAVGASG
ncbi:transcriptional regulator [uncultured Roseibium sp.]|uniref:transcriptional regulator n=1 Tax=uncultured Roseibium sp. TaxID=1936171 RepID=UPI0032172892